MRILKDYNNEVSIDSINIKELEELIRLFDIKKIELDLDIFYKLLEKGSKETRNRVSQIKVTKERYTSGIKYHYILKFFNKLQIKSFMTNNSRLNMSKWVMEDNYNIGFKITSEIVDKIKFIFDEFSHLFTDLDSSNARNLLYIIICEKDQHDIDPFTLSKINLCNNNLIEFMFLHKLEYLIKRYKVNDILKKNEYLEKKIGQKYLNNHAEDDELLQLMEKSNSPTYNIKSKLNNKYLDHVYIVKNLKHCNKRNLALFSEYWGWNPRYTYYSYRSKRKAEITDKNTTIFNMLSLKFSKYILENSKESHFIKNYFERKNESENKK